MFIIQVGKLLSDYPILFYPPSFTWWSPDSKVENVKLHANADISVNLGSRLGILGLEAQITCEELAGISPQTW